MKSTIAFIKENLAAVLVTVNALLALLLLFGGPNALIQFGSDGLLGVDSKSITGIEIDFSKTASNQDQSPVKIKLHRKELIAQNQEGTELKQNSKPNQSLYAWQLATSDGTSYNADQDRINDLISTLSTMRSDYDFTADKNENTKADYELGEQAVSMTLQLASGKTIAILIGRSSQRSGTSYVMLNDASMIHEVDANLRVKIGEGDTMFFRDRLLFPKEVSFESMTSFAFLQPQKTVRFAKAGSDWQMIEPQIGKVRNDVFRPVVDDVLKFRARSFLDKIPAGAAPQQSRIEVAYQTGSTEPAVIQFDIIASRDASTYYLKRVGGDDTVFEVSSYYFDDLNHPLSMLDHSK